MVKIRNTKTPQRINSDDIAKGLMGRIINIPSLTKKESEEYKAIGSPVMISEADELSIYYYGSRMLEQHDASLDDVVGYRIVDMDEEHDFRKQCNDEYAPIVLYYTKKD